MIRRAWRVLADPPQTRAAAILRLAVPGWALVALLSLAPGIPWEMPLRRLFDVAWLYVVLVVVRQRDAARGSESDSEPVRASGHQDDPTKPPATP